MTGQGRVLPCRPSLSWWLCPADPPCPHGLAVHDGDGNDEDFTCCADGCDCRSSVTAHANSNIYPKGST